MLLILSENWTLAAGRDLPALVRWAREAEDAGFDAVMISEHVVLGPDSGARGIMGNPRSYALPGNQDPATPWPSSLLLLSAIAVATSRVRLVAGAVLAPLRHPLLLARELGTLDLLSQGRLVVQPSVSWSRDEYAALGVPFAQRGAILDSPPPRRRAGRLMPAPRNHHQRSAVWWMWRTGKWDCLADAPGGARLERWHHDSGHRGAEPAQGIRGDRRG
jgi:hypothetical protein